MIRAILITEGEFEDVVEFKTQEQCEAYGSGFSKAAGLYGGSAYVCSHVNLGELEPDNELDAKTIALILKHLGPAPTTEVAP